MRLYWLLGIILFVYFINYNYCQPEPEEKGDDEKPAEGGEDTKPSDEEEGSDHDSDEEQSKYQEAELREIFKLRHYPEYFIEGGMMNFSYIIDIPEGMKEKYKDLEEDILITQSGVYEIDTRDNYLLYHTGKFFAAAILSPKIPSHFKFLDAGNDYLVLYDFTDLMGKAHQMIYNIQVLEHVLRFPSKNVIPFIPNHDHPDHTGLLRHFNVPFLGNYYYEPGKDLTISFAEDNDERGKFVYVFNDDDIVHNMEVITLRNAVKSLEVNDYNIEVKHNSVTFKNCHLPPGLYVGYEVQKDPSVEHTHVLSSTGYITPKDMVIVTPATDNNRKLRWKFIENPKVVSFKILMHYTNLRLFHEIGECILGTSPVSCMFKDHDIMDEFGDLTESELMLKVTHTSKIFVKFHVTFGGNSREVTVRSEYFCAYNCDVKESIDIGDMDIPKNDGEKIILENGKNVLNKLQVAGETSDLSIRYNLAKECEKEIIDLLNTPATKNLPKLTSKLTDGKEKAMKLVAEAKIIIDKNQEVIDLAKKYVLDTNKKFNECVQLEEMAAQLVACDEADRLAKEAKELCTKAGLTYDVEIMNIIHENIIKQKEAIKKLVKTRKLMIADAEKLHTEAKDIIEHAEKETDYADKLYRFNEALEKLEKSKKLREEARDSKEAINNMEKEIEKAKNMKINIVTPLLQDKNIIDAINKKISQILEEKKSSRSEALKNQNRDSVLKILMDLAFHVKIWSKVAEDINQDKLNKDCIELYERIQDDISLISSGRSPEAEKRGHFNTLTIFLLIFLLILISAMLGILGVYLMKKRRYRMKKTIVISDSVSSI